MIVIGLAIEILIYGVEVIKDGVLVKHIWTTSTMSVLFVIYGLIYFYWLLKDDNDVKLTYSSSFWWVTGALFFYFGSTISNVFFNRLSTIMVSPKHYLTTYIFNALNLILYGCWCYSFICRKWEMKR